MAMVDRTSAEFLAYLDLYEQAPLLELGAQADAIRRELHPEPVVSYIVDRNINYTNVCVADCAFCAFYRRPKDREGYVLSFEEIGAKIDECKAIGGVQILLQGGHNPYIPFDWYLEPRGWPERTEAFLEGAEALFVDVAQKALASAHLAGSDIDTVVTVCSTGIATPSLEARVARVMGFRSDVTRVPVFGLGCAGGVSGLSIASRLAQARPGTNVLLVTIELCTLALRHDELTKANIVAVSLFGDGAAAVILRAGDGGVTRIENSGEHLWPDTLGIMGWSVDPEGFGVIFRRTIPDFVTAHLNPAVTQILAAMQLSMADIDRFICHPGENLPFVVERPLIE